MRKLFSIVLIFLLLLNVLGHFGLFLGWQYKNDLEMIQKLDSEDYSHSETVTIRIPLAIPYASDSRDFERVNGKFEHKDEFYRLVKQKLYKDTLSIVCLKDDQLKEIHRALKDYVKSLTDSPVNKQSSNGKSTPTFIKDYIACSTGVRSQNLGWEETFSYSCAGVLHPVSFSSSINHPPEV